MDTSSHLAIGFKDLISNPLRGTPAADTFSDACAAGNFTANLFTYLFYSFMMIFIIYNLAVAAYKIATSEEEETFVRFSAAMTNAFLAAFGMAFMMGVLFLPVNVLRIIGVKDSDNIFLKDCEVESTIN